MEIVIQHLKAYQYLTKRNKQELIIMNKILQNQPKTAKKQVWQAPVLDKITLAKTESGPNTGPEGGSGTSTEFCQPSS